jgi:hypothetical protein
MKPGNSMMQWHHSIVGWAPVELNTERIFLIKRR